MGIRTTRMDRRRFLATIGESVGGAAMLRTMAALGIGSTLPGCGSSSASEAPTAAPPPTAPPASNAPPTATTLSPRPGDWAANVGSGRSVVILGAGIAGMTAALELGRLGYACTLLEARSAAGGRTRTLRSGDTIEEVDSSQRCDFDAQDDLYFNAGPSRIPHHHAFLIGYCREFGVALETFVNDNRAARLHDPSAFGGAPQIARRVESDLEGHIASLLASAVDQGALDQELGPADRQNVLAMLRAFGDLDSAGRFGGTERSGFPGQASTDSRQRGERLPPLALVDLVGDTFFAQRRAFTDGLNQQGTMLQPVGGMDRIARAFEARIASDLILDAVVTAVRKTAGGVRIEYRRAGTPTEITADHCVVTLPATVLRDIPGDYSAAHKAEIDAFQYTSAVRIAFQAPRFWERAHGIYGGISWTKQDVTQLWYPSHGFGQDQGILLGSYIFGGPPGDRFTALSPQARLSTALAEGQAVHSELPGVASRGISVAWNKVPFQLGGWGVSEPSVLLTPDDAIVYAGEHLSILQGWQEGAILSAYRAIDQIVAASAG